MKRRVIYFEYQRYNPFRPVDWRWQRAEWLVANGRYFSKARDDSWTGRAVAYLRAERRRRFPWQHRQLIAAFPEVRGALQILMNHALRFQVEAWLLAGESPEKVASRLDLPPRDIDAHVALFFDIAGRLRSDLYILYHVIGVQRFIDADLPHAEGIVKLLGYRGGPAVLEAMLNHFSGNATADSSTDAVDLSTFEGRTRERIALTIEAISLPIDSKTGPDLVKHLTWLQKIPRFVHRERRSDAMFSQAALVAAEKSLPECGSPHKLAPECPVPPPLGRQVREAA